MRWRADFGVSYENTPLSRAAESFSIPWHQRDQIRPRIASFREQDGPARGITSSL